MTDLSDVIEMVTATKGRAYKDRHGLHLVDLAADLTRSLIVGTGPGREPWVYDAGRWRPDADDIQARLVEMMGDDYRPYVVQTATDRLKAISPYHIDPAHPANTGLLNFRNGMLDWQTGELTPHSPAALSINQIPHDWNPDAVAPRADAFMAEVFPPDAAQVGYELIGYSMFDGNPFQRAVMLLGRGENGKTKLLDLVGAVLGSENTTAVPLHALAENRFAAANLFGRLANIAGDIDDTVMKETARFKQITGGDLITVERKFQHPFDFHVRAFPMFSANEFPGSLDTSLGFTRRWLVVEFPNKFTKGVNADGDLGDKLAAEAEGVIVRSVEALRRIMAQGDFTQTAAIVEAHERMVHYVNPIRTFVDEAIEPAADKRKTRAAVYTAYKTWCDENGLHPLSTKRFMPKFRDALTASDIDYGEVMVSGARYWDRIDLSGPENWARPETPPL